MNWNNRLVAATIVLLALSAPSLFAQDTPAPQPAQPAQEAPESQPAADAAESQGRANDQHIVIGTGFGGHTFSTTHKVQQDSIGLEVISAFMQQIYAEWYALDKFGFGLRYINFGASASASSSITVGSTTASASAAIDLTVNNFLFTVNWVPLGGKRYARMGVLAGLGVSDYELTTTTVPGSTTTTSTSGPASLVGLYLDWGAGGFGARFGAQLLATDLDPINGAPVDVSGREIYLDLRWAF